MYHEGKKRRDNNGYCRGSLAEVTSAWDRWSRTARVNYSGQLEAETLAKGGGSLDVNIISI